MADDVCDMDHLQGEWLWLRQISARGTRWNDAWSSKRCESGFFFTARSLNCSTTVNRNFQDEERLQVWLVDDHRLFRTTCAEILEADFGLRCARQFEMAQELIEALRDATKPDVLLLDVNLPGMSGAAALKLIKPLAPFVDVFIYSMEVNFAMEQEVIQSGASGFFTKTQPIAEVVAAIREVVRGRRSAPPLTDADGINPRPNGFGHSELT